MKNKRFIYLIFLVIAIGIICYSILGLINNYPQAPIHIYSDEYMTFSYPNDWQIIKSDSGEVTLNDSGIGVTVTLQKQPENDNSAFEEIRGNGRENGAYYTINGTNLTYEVFSNVPSFTSVNLIKKGDKLFSISYSGDVDKFGVELILKTIQ